MIVERLSQEHRNIERLLAVLERELEIFDRGDRPDYEVIRAVISYFELYPEVYHHPQEDLVFAKLEIRDPAAAAKVGNLALEHQTTVSSRIVKSFGKMWTLSSAISWGASGVTS